MGEAGAHRGLERRLVGPGHHQHVAAVGVLHHARASSRPASAGGWRARSQPHRQPGGGRLALDVGHRVAAVVEDRRGQRRLARRPRAPAPCRAGPPAPPDATTGSCTRRTPARSAPGHSRPGAVGVDEVNSNSPAPRSGGLVHPRHHVAAGAGAGPPARRPASSRSRAGRRSRPPRTGGRSGRPARSPARAGRAPRCWSATLSAPASSRSRALRPRYTTAAHASGTSTVSRGAVHRVQQRRHCSPAAEMFSQTISSAPASA